MANYRDLDVAELDAAIDRLAAEWREARTALGLSRGAPWSKVTETLGIDRGSAQRLVRLGRMVDPGAADLEHVPGPAGWDRIQKGLAAKLGHDHGATSRLELACERFGECLATLGGSKSSALRRVAGDEVRAADPLPSSLRARRRWFESAAEIVGYRMEVKLNLRVIRPAASADNRFDIARVNVFLGCRGHRGSLPLAVTRFATSPEGEVAVGSSDPSAGRYTLLESVTSTPPPNLLSTTDEDHNTVFIEPAWADRRSPLDIGIMQKEPGGLANHEKEEPPLLILSSLMVHPARRSVSQVLLHPDLARTNFARLAAYRDIPIMGQNRNWFDRLPESATLTDLDRSRSSDELDFFPDYNEFVSEVDQKLGWDLEAYVGHQAVIDHPIPFARYAIEYEYHGDRE